MLKYVGADIAGRTIKAVHPWRQYTAGIRQRRPGWAEDSGRMSSDSVVLIFTDGSFTLLTAHHSGEPRMPEIFAPAEATLYVSTSGDWLVEIGLITQSERDGFEAAEEALRQASHELWERERYAELRAKFNDKEPDDLPPLKASSEDGDGGLFRTLFGRKRPR